MAKRIIIASSSPRRAELLKRIGLPFTVVHPKTEEDDDPALRSEELTEELAKAKVEAVLEREPHLSKEWVLAADTIIDFHGKRYGKPKNREEAERYLRNFSGTGHRVITGIALFNPQKPSIDCSHSISFVHFSILSEDEIKWYIDSGEWKGAAGAYRIQGAASCIISYMQGSYSNVMGLPIRELYLMLRQNNYFKE